MWLEGFSLALSGTNMLWLALGTVVGLVVGVLPALGNVFGVSLMLPFTFGMEPATAIIFLMAIHAACNYGDSITSIMLNTPGGPGTVATCWDGYPLVQKGWGGKALGIATFSSFIGGVLTWITLAILVRPVTMLAMEIGATEYFALGVMAITLVSVASKGETMKGLIMACLGLALSFVGQDGVSGLTYRFTYGITWLEAGIPIVVSALGVFAISQVIVLFEEGGSVAKTVEIKDSLMAGLPEVIRRPLTLLRAGAVGWFVGILPAMGVSLAGMASYLVEKKYSRESAQFGKGAPGGLIAAEVGKGACVVGDLIPTFTLGVPGSVVGAILMAALIIHGIDPGPKFLLQGALPYTVFASLLLAQVAFLISGLLVGKFLARIAYLPNALIAPIVTVLSLLGAFAERSYTFDILLVVAFGLLAYTLGKLGYPVVCMVLGLILGPLLEANFHRSLAISYGSYAVFVTRPIAGTMLGITALFLAWPYLVDLFQRLRRVPVEEAGTVSGEVISGKKSSPGEVIMLVVIALLMAAFLYTARDYRPDVRLFPNLIAAAGLALSIYRLAGIITHISAEGWSGMRPAPLFSGRLSWPWSILTMAAYALLVYVVGFVIASGLYVAAAVTLVGFQKWPRAIITGVLVAAGVLLMSKGVDLLLPVGLLGLRL